MKASILFDLELGEGEVDFESVEIERLDRDRVAVSFTNEQGDWVQVVFERRHVKKLLDWKLLLSL
jgi:hypothetical protein